MKKIVCLLVAALIGIAGGAYAQGQIANDAAAIAASEQLMQEMSAGQYDLVIDRLSDKVKGQITQAQLEDAWTQVTKAYGSYLGKADVKAIKQGDGWAAQGVCQFENGEIALVCAFDAQMKLGGFNFQPIVKSDAPIDIPLPEGASEEAITLFEESDRALAGALVRPANWDENTPVALLVHGSGASDKDETVMANKPFRDLAYGLAARGVASLRYDKMNYAHPALFSQEMSIDLEYRASTLEALSFAQGAGLGKVFLIGHSEGGMLTPWLMREGKDFAGGVVLAGTPRKLWQVSRAQNLAMIALMPEESRAQAMEMVSAQTEKAEALKAMTRDEARKAEPVFGAPAAYLWEMEQLDALQIVQENACPLLILQGEADFQVSVQDDFAAWREGLGDMGGMVAYKCYPGLSHLFMPCPEGATVLDAQTVYAKAGQMDAQVIEDIANWITEVAAG